MICVNELSSFPTRPTCGADAGPAAFAILVDVLRELAEFIAGLGDVEYTTRSPLAGGSTIGAHVRHSLDHVRLFLAGIEEGTIDYDRRDRATAVERQRHSAFDMIGQLERQLRECPNAILERAIRVRGVLTADGPPVEAGSSVGRELMFVLSHTIHHNAMIAAAARRLGAAVPPRFGVAPATQAFLSRSACAPSPSSR
ncbi:MAG: DinB family protein [Planctomycetes bacterium]|nr:DinB family protein [Planctomycetota bacterium]